MLDIKPISECHWDIVSLGEVMLRFDPGDDRIHTARSFRVWEGGGEYNVARNLAKCFRQRAAIVTALADNQIGRLVEDLIMHGGVDVSEIVWRDTDGISRSVRNGMYFMERGFGMRTPKGCSDRGNTAIAQLKPGDIDWENIFVKRRTRWFHTGGIFAGLSGSTVEAAAEAMGKARASGTVVSYDLNYRESLWSVRGGRDAANEANQRLLPFADVVFGLENFDSHLSKYSEKLFRDSAEKMIDRHPNIKVLATTLRDVTSASKHSIGGVCYYDGSVFRSKDYLDVEVLDRVGSGDAFAAGSIVGWLNGLEIQKSIEIAAASAVLSMASVGDGLSSTADEIERLASSGHAHALR